MRGTLRPGLFLPLAERNGLIVPLTELVLDRAVAACARLARPAASTIGISVNLSARSLLDDVAAATRSPTCCAGTTCRRTCSPWRSPRASCSATPTGRSACSPTCATLGVRLSLDDFGTGYSSLTHLSELPIQQLKIDRSFVSQITRSDRDSAIVEPSPSLARHLDLEVVAEGIETAGDRGAAARPRLPATARATTSRSRWPPTCCRCGCPRGRP